MVGVLLAEGWLPSTDLALTDFAAMTTMEVGVVCGRGPAGAMGRGFFTGLMVRIFSTREDWMEGAREIGGGAYRVVTAAGPCKGGSVLGWRGGCEVGSVSVLGWRGGCEVGSVLRWRGGCEVGSGSVLGWREGCEVGSVLGWRGGGCEVGSVLGWRGGGCEDCGRACEEGRGGVGWRCGREGTEVGGSWSLGSTGDWGVGGVAVGGASGWDLDRDSAIQHNTVNQPYHHHNTAIPSCVHTTLYHHVYYTCNSYHYVYNVHILLLCHPQTHSEKGGTKFHPATVNM